MIKKLRRKFILMVMAVVTLILLAIFSTMLLSTKANGERMSLNMLYQALNAPLSMKPPLPEGPPSRPEGRAFSTRLPVLVVETDESGAILSVSNQLHFIDESDVAPIAALALKKSENTGVLSAYALRYLKQSGQSGTRIAFADISTEQEILKTQVANALLILCISLFAFFLLSLFLARAAVRPVEAAWERQKQFIANASHELKTPLTVILSNAVMLRAEKGLEHEKNARRAEHIHVEAKRMKELVEAMLTLARSDEGKTRDAHAPLDLSYLIKSSVLMYEPVAYDAGKALAYEIEEGLFARGDMSALQQVVHILLDNALKYSAPNGSIRVALQRAEHKKLLLTVSSEGEPIPKNELKAIFLRFYRRDEARSAEGSFGLGLSIAEGIVSAHKGKIWAESDEKKGNSFYVLLPI